MLRTLTEIPHDSTMTLHGTTNDLWHNLFFSLLALFFLEFKDIYPVIVEFWIVPLVRVCKWDAEITTDDMSFFIQMVEGRIVVGVFPLFVRFEMGRVNLHDEAIESARHVSKYKGHELQRGTCLTPSISTMTSGDGHESMTTQ